MLYTSDDEGIDICMFYFGKKINIYNVNYRLFFVLISTFLIATIFLNNNQTVKADTTIGIHKMMTINNDLTTNKSTTSLLLTPLTTTIVSSGKDGTCTWDIDGDGKLTIHAGVLADGQGSWISYASSITSVSVDKGVSILGTSGDYGPFSGLTNVKTIDVTNLDVSNATTLKAFFRNDSNLTQISGLNTWNTSKCTDMSYLFINDKSLTSMDISKFDTSNVTNLSYTFSGVDFTKGDSDEIKNWNVSKVNIMNYLFKNTVFDSLDLSNWNISSVTKMDGMFSGDNNIDKVKNIADWNTSKVTSMSSMFSNTKETDLSFLENWDVSNVKDMNYMFSGNSNLTGLDISKWKTTSLSNAGYMFYNSHLLNEDNLKGYQTLVTDKVTNMAGMFSFTSFKTIDLSKYDTSSIKSMDYLFIGASNLKKVIGDFDTSSVTSMNYMFKGTNLSDTSEFNIADWDTSKVTSMNNMFADAEIFDMNFLKNWNTNSLTSMSSMFSGFSGATTIPLQNWNVSKVTSFSKTFYNAKTLTDLPIENWDTSNAKDFNSMFSSMTSLETLDLSNFDTTKAADVVSTNETENSNVDNIFTNDTSLWKIELGPKVVLRTSSGIPAPVSGTAISGTSYKADSDRWQEVDKVNGGTDHVPVGDLITNEAIMKKFSSPGSSAVTYVWQQQPKTDIFLEVPDIEFGNVSSYSGLVYRKINEFSIEITNDNYPEEAMQSSLSVSMEKPLTDVSDNTKTLNNVLIFKGTGNDNVLSSEPTEIYDGKIGVGTNDLKWDRYHGVLLNMNNDKYALNGNYSTTLDWTLTSSI
ncbi:hypothetical protein LKI01_02800 [Companilactobacillus paralimentarius]|uniref:BspA family leucine-rich repeat surface protein n=2 Tax=Companilactobacillus kimchii TaxID=2801452 RepID=A0A210PCY3_9LACO|nr:hypothetical protein ATN91_06420 [Companilactobacillus kimchii]OWF34359.1 hypothetical protein LKACC12383_00272 [Companilactobacillus kimchii]GEO46281.1 hypothetical protein LKI01_02800 [Companilactobacillus paralimentarius]